MPVAKYSSHVVILGLRCTRVSLDGRVVRSTLAMGPPTVSPSPIQPFPESPPRYLDFQHLTHSLAQLATCVDSDD